MNPIVRNNFLLGLTPWTNHVPVSSPKSRSRLQPILDTCDSTRFQVWSIKRNLFVT
jgi:hypothetical protein